jgi:hypothetical protein
LALSHGYGSYLMIADNVPEPLSYRKDTKAIEQVPMALVYTEGGTRSKASGDTGLWFGMR